MPPILATATQSALLKATAALIVQVVSYRGRSSIDIPQLVEFAIFGFIGAHISYAWHLFLEETFPLRQQQRAHNKNTKNDNSSPISWANLLLKVFVDQLIGLPLLSATFLICTNVNRVDGATALVDVILGRMTRVVMAGWRLWPTVALVNFLWVPMRWRVLFLNIVGFGWTICLSILSR